MFTRTKPRQRSDAGPRADQDDRRPPPRRTESGIAADEGPDSLTGLEVEKLSGAEPSRMFRHADFSEPVSRGGGQRIEPRDRGSLGYDAKQITGRETRSGAPDEPTEEWCARQAKRNMADGACISEP